MNQVKFFLILVCIFLSGAIVCQGALNQKNIFRKAILAYQNMDYEHALELFELLNQDIQSAGLFYNAGNCYMKMNKPGLGIASYYSALSRDPLNPDIRHNISYAKKRIRDHVPQEEEIHDMKDVFNNIVSHFTIKTHQIIFCLIYFSFIFILIRLHQKDKPVTTQKGMILLMVLCLFSEGLALKIRVQDMKKEIGILVVFRENVRYEPNDLSTVAYVFHEGSKFDILNRKDQWIEIQLKDGKKGWIPVKSMISIK